MLVIPHYQKYNFWLYFETVATIVPVDYDGL